MPTRFDHAVIAVRNLDDAIQRFQRLGFDTQPGGQHASGDTHNALIRFGLDYVELLAVYDEERARTNNDRGLALLNALNGREAALVGFALATNQIEEEAARFKGTSSEPSHPHAMGRTRPDGQRLSWRVASPQNVAFGCPWPFLIQWDTDDAQRLQIDTPGSHANGITGWSRITVITSDFTTTLGIYRNQLELDMLKLDISSHQVARTALLGIGRNVIALLGPMGAGPAQRILDEQHEGPIGLSFRATNLHQTSAYLQQQGIAFQHHQSGTPRITLSPEETAGLQIHITE